MPAGVVVLLSLILLPLIEIAVFIEVGSAIGVLPTIALTVLTAIAGTAMLRHQGLALLMKMRSELDAGRVPGEELTHGALIVVASILLLIPGFVTDVVGLLLFVPAVRRAIGHFVIRRADVVIVSGTRRRSGRVVDLDAEDWSSSSASGNDGSDGATGPRRIGPTSAGPE